jgi:hypothetical protein
MTSSEQPEHPVANPERTVLDEHGQPHGADEQHKSSDPHDQPWPEVAREVKEAVEHADGPLK